MKINPGSGVFIVMLSIYSSITSADQDTVDALKAISPSASSDRVHLALATLENLSENLWFIGYQSVEELSVNGDDTHKYMLLDFRFESVPDEEQLHASVKKICYSVYRNTPLIQDLSQMGYDQVAIAFDDNSQYDCL